jgi:Rrf2 family protein
MELTKRGEYGLLALYDLAKRYGEGPISSRELAERNDIPPRFLEQILLALTRGYIVRSRRGPGGGYVLARAPEDISLAEVVRLLDGPLAPISCVSETAYEPCHWPDTAAGLQRVMQEVRDAVAAIMENTTLADVAAG